MNSAPERFQSRPKVIEPRFNYGLKASSVVGPSRGKQAPGSQLLQAPVEGFWRSTELVVVGVAEAEEGVLQLRQVRSAQAFGSELSPELDNVLKYCVSQYVKCMYTLYMSTHHLRLFTITSC